MIENFKKLIQLKYLVLIFPIFLISIKIIGNLILLIIFLIGLRRYFVEHINPFTNRDSKMISIISIVYFFVILFSIILNSGLGEEIRHIARKLHYFLLPIISLAFINFQIDSKKLILSLKISLIFIGTIVCIQSLHSMFVLEDYIFGGSRYSGMINANVLGDIVVIIIFMSIVRVFDETSKELLLTALSLGLGFVTLFQTGSRGSWITFIVLGLFFVFLKLKQLSFSVKNRKLFLSGIGIFLIIFSSLFIPKVLEIYDRTSNNLGAWGSNHEIYSSSGVRLEMWSAAFEAFKDAPWYGYGYRLANSKVSEYTEYHAELISSFTHLHNEYITNLLSAGIPGLISLLVMIFIPFFFFYKSRKTDENYIFSIMGICLTLGYAISGFTHIAFGEEHLNAFYVLYLSLLVLLIKNNQNLLASKINKRAL